MLRKEGEQKETGCYSTQNQQIQISGGSGEDTEKKKNPSYPTAWMRGKDTVPNEPSTGLRIPTNLYCFLVKI